MTDEELRKVVERLAATQEETFRRMEAQWAETSHRMEAERAKTERVLRETNRQLGALGNKFGGYTEGLAIPSVKKLLHQRFKMDVVGERMAAHQNGRSLELDAFGLSNQEHGDAYIVEIKSRVGEDEFQQVLDTLREAPKFFPQFRDKRLYGIVVAVDIPKNMRRRILNAGLYLMLAHENTFRLAVPRGFKPKVFYDGTKRS